ncbi:MAG TPA: AMP-binding protein [Pseudonocardiaceae bacterium]|jgi:acyl-CoA synthetase (AMP-forming)/AMP-acid ligase II|nr:AMP-binding protein [Pseudonocardiaceae bacterium]
MAALSRLLAVRANERPAAAAFIVGADGRELSWRDLSAQADALRELTVRRDLPPRSRIGLTIADPLAFTATYLGALATGSTVVPLDPRLTEAELAASIARLRIDVLATDEPNRHLAPVESWAVGPTGPTVLRTGHGNLPSAGAALRPAVLLASSGTTGAPKGIPLSEWQLLDAARRVARHHGFGPDQRGYTPLPLFHVNAQVMGLLATVVSGASLVIDRRFDATEYWARVARWQPTWLNAVPAILAALLEQRAPSTVDGIRFARSASAPLPETVLRRFADHTGISVLETYGMTEAAGQIAANPIAAGERRIGSVGLPVGIDLAVLDARGLPSAPGVEGMVALRGRQVVSHYLDLDEHGPERARAARDSDGWLRTGDLGRLDADGFVYLAGRADDVINRGGEKIHPKEVEDVLLTHPLVASAAVVAAPHDRLGQVAVAFVTARAGSSDRSGDPDADLAKALELLCERRLTRYKRPALIEVTNALPRGPTGKILRRALRAELTPIGAAR